MNNLMGRPIGERLRSCLGWIQPTDKTELQRKARNGELAEKLTTEKDGVWIHVVAPIFSKLRQEAISAFKSGRDAEKYREQHATIDRIEQEIKQIIHDGAEAKAKLVKMEERKNHGRTAN